MLTKFWEGVGTKLAERWVAAVVTPAFVFWLAGVASWSRRHDISLEALVDRHLVGSDGAPRWSSLLFGLLIVLGSAALVQTFDRSIMRLLEGYWWLPLRPLRTLFIWFQSLKFSRDEKRFQQLHARKVTDLSRAERDTLVRVERRLHHAPTEKLDRMPTRFGNSLRAAELAPKDSYGLDAVICLPRLWLVLPETASTELGGAVDQMETSVRWWFWSALSLVWAAWAWWAVPLAFALMILSYRSVIQCGETYGELLRSAFDLYRFDLYRSLRWPLPSSPSEDVAIGTAVTQYLWRGSDSDSPAFEHGT